MPTPSTRHTLVIGIDPYAVAHLGIDPQLISAALARGQERFEELGIPADLCLVGLDGDGAVQTITEQLQGGDYACVVIGGGIRKPEPLLELFEVVINLVREHAPNAAIAFNTNGENSVDAALRWLPSGPTSE